MEKFSQFFYFFRLALMINNIHIITRDALVVRFHSLSRKTEIKIEIFAILLLFSPCFNDKQCQ